MVHRDGGTGGVARYHTSLRSKDVPTSKMLMV